MKSERDSSTSLSYSAIHPPLFRNGLLSSGPLIGDLLPWTLLNYVHRLPTGFPLREWWISLPQTTQVALKPIPVFVVYCLVRLLFRQPTTSYFYPGSPGFRWAAFPSSHLTSRDERWPDGCWVFDWQGLSSDPHPVSNKKGPATFERFCWLSVSTSVPYVVAYFAYVLGYIGNLGEDPAATTFMWWFCGGSIAATAVLLYLVRDGGALDFQRLD